MSGAEALFAVGIICNAMQIITFGKDALHVYRSIRDNGAPDPRLESYLDLAAKGYKSLGDRSRGPRPLTNDQQQIFDLSEKAYKSLEAFQSKFQELHLDMQSRKGLVGSLRVVKAGFKTLVNDKELKDLEKDFQRYEQLLQVHLIQRVCSQSDASALLTQDAFTKLEVTQQEVVIKLAEGRTQLCDLISRESVMVKDHVQNQHLETRLDVNTNIHTAERHIMSHISESGSKVQNEFASQRQVEDDKNRQQQLLASLRYPEMNARKNQIATNFPSTCHWIFKTAGPSRISSTSSTDSDHYEEDYSDDSSDNWSEDVVSDNQDQTDTIALGNISDSSERIPEEPTPFARWLMSDSGMFWISGKPASGKSTLMKFIATSRLTRDNLEVWSPSVQILTHYFWKAGSEMERNLRGMLLSLTHQVLLYESDLIRRLWEEPEISFVHHKWSHADWALEEIENVLCKALEVSDDAFFIILDGLDESTEFEKYFSVLNHNSNVLDRLIQLKKVKICASSREENTFCCYFEGAESLRIQDLTKHDIRKFANSRLKALNLSDSWDRDCLLDEVTSRADGVFLWVSLVLDSVTRACRLTNDIETLIERVKHAPRDIMKLFQDIWERCGEDGDVASYRVTASRYLNLVLSLTQCQEHDYHYSIDKEFHSFLVLSMASETRSIKSMLDPARGIAIPDLLERCSKVEQELSITCCGLLELSDREIDFKPIEVPDSLIHYDKKGVRFVHRCAIDYLTDTESGAALLGACCWSKEELIPRLIGGYMMRARFLKPMPARIKLNYIADGRRFFHPVHIPLYLDKVLFIGSELLSGSSWHEFFTQTSRKWHLAGLFPQRLASSYPGRPTYVTDPKLQFLDIAVHRYTLLAVTTLLTELSAQQLLDSIPAIMRGLARDRYGNSQRTKCISVTRIILTRLLDLSKVEGNFSSPGIRALCRHVSCRLWSWFFATVVGEAELGMEVKLAHSLPSDILHLFAIAIPDIEDWRRPLPLYIGMQKTYWSAYMDFNVSGWEHFAILNFATAYKISLSICGGQRLVPEQVPDFIGEVQPRFQPIVYRTIGSDLLYAIWPDQQDELGAQLMASILEWDPFSNEEPFDCSNGMPVIAKGADEVTRYLIDTVGHMEDMPFHSWRPEWEIQDIDEEQSTGRRPGSKE